MAGYKTWVFTGDMGGQTGMFSECVRFAGRFNLPIRFVIEDNGVSVKTPTLAVWPVQKLPDNVIRYHYKNKYPHQGTGVKVEF